MPVGGWGVNVCLTLIDLDDDDDQSESKMSAH